MPTSNPSSPVLDYNAGCTQHSCLLDPSHYPGYSPIFLKQYLVNVRSRSPLSCIGNKRSSELQPKNRMCITSCHRGSRVHYVS